jgi:outer membrane protein assembly factor BamE (lipoprotein component of BamABCDE complex)
MIRKAAPFVLASILLLGACTPITSYQGFQAVEANPRDVKVGADTKSTVLERLGSPTAVAAFEPNTWYYISQISDAVAFRKPNVKKRDIVAVTFNKADERVLKVDTYTLKDGHIIAFNNRHTPTRGRELSILEQILGNIGQSQVMPQEDINPGSQRPR